MSRGKRVILGSEDWARRALLRAQLLEEGVEVEAYETIAEAARVARRQRAEVALLIADLAASSKPAADLAAIRASGARPPVWVIASRPGPAVEPETFEAALLLPLDLGKLVERIRERIDRPENR